MRVFKSRLNHIIVAIIMMSILTCYSTKIINANATTGAQGAAKVAVLMLDYSDPYNYRIKQGLEKIQKENSDKVEYTFFDGKANPAIQAQNIDNALKEDFDLIVLSLYNINEDVIKNIISKLKVINKPFIIFSTIDYPNIFNGFKNGVVLRVSGKNGGIEQGKILVHEWNNNKETMDKNKDNILEYIILKGETTSTVGRERSEYPILTLKEAGIQTKELAQGLYYWSKDAAKSGMESFILRYNGNVEAVIASTDDMAIGAVEVLQKYGYNIGDKSKTIPVVGINGMPEAISLIDKGYMLGTVFQDPEDESRAIYVVGMNLINGNNPTQGTNYSIENSIITVPQVAIPYRTKSVPEAS